MFSVYINSYKTACSAEDVTYIEQATREQSKCQLWGDLRKAGRLTSSNFGALCKMRPTTQPDCMLKKILGYYNESDDEHRKWGRTHEAAARRWYETTMKKSHPGLHVRKSGLVIDMERPYLASSPDGSVVCPHCSPTQGLLEVKCPSIHRDHTPMEACMKDRDFCLKLVDGRPKLKENHNFYFQVPGQMGVAGKGWCDFVVWTLKLKGQHVGKNVFDTCMWIGMLEKLEQFFAESVVPELFTN